MISVIPVTSNGLPPASGPRCSSTPLQLSGATRRGVHCTESRPPGLARFRTATVAGILLLTFPAIAIAQHVNSDLWVTDGTVNATAVAGNTLYIGGRFSHVGPYTGGGVPLGAAGGAALSGFPKVHGTVRTVAGDGSGGWFIGGDFDSVGGLARANLAHVRSDLTVAPWAPNANGTVYALTVGGSTVYAGGYFTSIGGQTRSNIAALDAA